MRLTVVGCAGSFPGPDSAASCYLVEADDEAGRTWRVLLDLGSGALGPLQRLVPLDSLDAVLLSHLHPDHCLDLCGLYVARHYHPAGTPLEPLPVFGPAGTGPRLARAYGDGGDGLPDTFAIQEWKDGGTVRVGPLSVTPRLVDHPVEAYGLRLEHEGRVLAYSGDTDACAPLDDVARGADLLLAEASFVEGRDELRGIHLTGRRAGETARDAGAARLVLTHIPAWTDPATVLGEAREVFTGPVETATPAGRYDV